MQEEYPSPDGLFVVALGCNEYRMSHWVCSPRVREIATQRVVFDAGSLWDAWDIRWTPDSTEVSFNLRKYPGSDRSLECRATVRLADGQVTLQREGQPEQVIDAAEAKGVFGD